MVSQPESGEKTKETRMQYLLEKVMTTKVLLGMVKCDLVPTLAPLSDHTPEIMMSVSQRLHVLADPIAVLIT